MPEFDLIRRLQEIISPVAGDQQPGCLIGIGDDAAVLGLPPGRQLVVCTDTLVEGVHFLPEASPRSVGFKSLAVNLSDLAAMGADPAWFLMALTLPSADPGWIDAFAEGMAELARKSRITLAGGDISSGSLNISITALGLVSEGRALTRSGAKPGDLIVVSGAPGAAANALRLLRTGGLPDPEDLQALEFPRPRLALGKALQGHASSCIDISDGLLADLGHILEQSSKGAELELSKLPCPKSLERLPDDIRWPLQLSGGDDYELCFTIPPSSLGRLDELALRGQTALTVIGTVKENPGFSVKDPGGGRYEAADSGYEHFR